jgi:small subunit ribosomal protein S8
VIRELHRVSKPGRRIYTKVENMPRFYNGLGLTIISTPRGVMGDQQARDENVGGEILCQVF